MRAVLRAPGNTDRLDWLQLYRSENVGPRTFDALIGVYGDARGALEALPHLARRGGLGRDTRIQPHAEAEREFDALRRMGGTILVRGEPHFPPLLALADGAPPILSVLGLPHVLARPSIAIVGGRNASAAGRTFAARLAVALGGLDQVVASGLARGIDGAAHEGALATGTVAVIAGGLDRVYPPEHLDLARRIADSGGAVVTEMPMGWSARAQDFPRRNRIIAGVAQGTVVVEAALRSGSLITARLATELGREVMVAPGSPLDPRCEGSNRLIREGATLVLSADHVLEALRPQTPSLFCEPDVPALAPGGAQPDAPAGDLRATVLALLGPSPVAVNDLLRHAEASAREVQMVLLELELAGRLDRQGGDRVALIA